MSPLVQAFLNSFTTLSCVITWWSLRLSRSWTTAPAINWPVVGMMPGLLRNATRVHDFTTDMLRHGGGTFIFKGPWFGGLDFVFTSDPCNVHHILSKNFLGYGKGPEIKQVLDPLGDGILTSDGKDWMLQRRIIHSFTKDRKFELARERATNRKIEDGLFVVLDQALELGNSLDIQDVLRRLMFDIVSQLVLDYDPNTLSLGLPESKCANAFTVIEEVTFLRNITPQSFWKLQKWLRVGKEKELTEACETFDDFLYGCIATKRQQLARDDGGSGARNQSEEDDHHHHHQYNLLNYFLVDGDFKLNDVNNEDEDTFSFTKSDKFLRDTACSFVAAGRDSVAAGFAWFLWLVATNPSVEKKIVEEMEEISDAKDRHTVRIFIKEELSKLVYLQASILETLRLYPPIPIDRIVSMGDDTLPSGHQISKNTRVAYVPYSMGRMESIWGPDCLEFKPERWISGQGKKKLSLRHVPAYKFSVFNTGPRTCLGKELALEQMKAVGAAILWRYRFQVVEDHPVFPTKSVILHMKHGLKVKVLKRNNI